MKLVRAGVLFGVTLGAAAALASCAQSGAPEQAEYQLDYPSYASLGDMCEQASLVVSGTPVGTEVRNVNVLAEDQGDTPEENPALGTGKEPEDAYIVETVTTVKVDQVVSGSHVEQGDLIEVGQPGGLFEGVNYVAEQYVISEGETHLLFLQEFDGVPANLVNPSQAGFAVTSEGTISGASASSLASSAADLKVGPELCD